MKRLFIMIVMTFFMVGLGGVAIADIIFFDDFNRDDSITVGNDWTEIENGDLDVAINDNTLRLRDFQDDWDAAAIQNISLLNYNDVHLDFEWSARITTEPEDKIYVMYSTVQNPVAGSGGDYQELWSHDLGGSDFVSISLDFLGLSNAEHFSFAFLTSVDDVGEFVRIDNVSLNAAPVPEPATMLLFGTGLAGLAGYRKRKAMKK